MRGGKGGGREGGMEEERVLDVREDKPTLKLSDIHSDMWVLDRFWLR